MTHPLEPFVQAWHGTADDLLDLLPSLSDDDWSQPTDLPGWTVHDVAAHLAHLEAVLAGHDTARPVTRAGGRGPSADYTQAGVDARADRSPDELIDELRRSVEARVEAIVRSLEERGRRAAPIQEATDLALAHPESIADLARVPDILRARGYSEDDVAAIGHGNALRFLKDAWS